MLRLLLIFSLVFFQLTMCSQTEKEFESLYGKAMEYNLRNKDSSLHYLKVIRAFFKKPTPIQKAKIHYLNLKLLGTSFKKDTTVYNLENALTSLSTSDTLSRANIILKIARYYSSKNDSHKDIYYFLEAISLFRNLEKQNMVNQCKIYLSESYRKKRQHENGILILREVLQEKDLLPKHRAKAYSRLAALLNEYQGSEEVDSIIKYSNKCLDLSKENNFVEYMALSQNELGYIYHRKLKDYVLAENYYLEANTNFHEIKDFENLINTDINLSELYVYQGKYDKALGVISKSLNYIKEDKATLQTMRLYLQFYNVYKLRGNYKEALEFQNLARLIERMIYFNKIDDVTFEMAAKYDLEAKKKEIKNQQGRNKLLSQRNRLLWIVSFLLVFVISIIIYSYQIKQKLHKQKLLIARSENLVLKDKIEIKNRELVTTTLKMINRRALGNSVNPRLKKIAKRANSGDKSELLKICNEINIHAKTNFWDEFIKNFNEVNISFYKNLKGKYPKLTKNEKKLCAFIKLNMDTKDIASLLGVSVRGVETARYRLRKKMNLKQGITIYEILAEF